MRTVKYADGLVPLARAEGVLQDTADRLTEIEKCYGKEMNVGNAEVKRLAR